MAWKERTVKCPYIYCSTLSIDEARLRSHIAIMHVERSCEKCGQVFESMAKLRAHHQVKLSACKIALLPKIDRIRLLSQRVKCPRCPVILYAEEGRFPPAHSLRVHNGQKHNPKDCNECGYAFSCRADFKYHLIWSGCDRDYCRLLDKFKSFEERSLHYYEKRTTEEGLQEIDDFLSSGFCSQRDFNSPY